MRITISLTDSNWKKILEEKNKRTKQQQKIISASKIINEIIEKHFKTKGA